MNIAGLSVGIGISLVIFMIIRYELSIDAFHQKRDRIYRVVSQETYRNGAVEYDGDVPIALGEALQQEFPQPEKVTSLWKVGWEEFSLAGSQNKKLRTSDVYFVQPSFFHIFDFPWLSSTPDAALKDPNTVALTRTIANSWFGNWQDAVGKTILVGLDRIPYKVTGIMEDAPSNTDLQLKVLLSYVTFRNNNQSAFSDPGNYDNFNPSSQCFFLLGKNQQIASMEKLLPGFIKRHYEPLAAGSNTSNSSLFQPLKEMHFDARFDRFSGNGLSYVELLTMVSIGIFILLMVCVNFINFSTV